jgi:hypothetical protein
LPRTTAERSNEPKLPHERELWSQPHEKPSKYEASVYPLTSRSASKSIKTPGFPRPVRIALAARALRDERTVARWLRGESIMPGAEAAIAQAAAELGVVRP